MEGTVSIFDSQMVMRPLMSDETVKKISAENQETIEKRIAMGARIRDLQDAVEKIDALPGQVGDPEVS